MEKMLVVYNQFSRNKYRKKLDKIKSVIEKRFEYIIYNTEGPKSILGFFSNTALIVFK